MYYQTLVFQRSGSEPETYYAILSGNFSKTAEIRYQMEKLKVRGLIEKCQNTNYYRVTEKGYVWLNIAYSHNRYLLTPLLSEKMENEQQERNDGLNIFELTQTHIKTGLHVIYQEFNIAA